MPTNEWTMADDVYGSSPGARRKTRVAIAIGVLVVLALSAALYFADVPGEGVPSLGSKSYSANVDCQVNTVGSQGTVTISGTITGDATNYSVTVDVLDAASQQRIGGQTFEVRGTTTFGGTTPTEAPLGSAGIDCKIVKVA
jgi:hypothetical protein